MKASKLKPGDKLGPTLVVESVERDGDAVRVVFESGGIAEYHVNENLGGT